MVTITDTRLRSTIYQTVYALINAAKATYNTTVTPTVYGGHPDLDSVTFPNIVINPIAVSEDDYTVDETRNVSTKSIVVVIEAYTKGLNSSKDIDNLADGITYTLRNNTFPGAFLTGVEEDDGVIFPNDNKVRQKTLAFTYMRR